MEKAVGETITLVRTNPATGAETRERAQVLAANGGVVLQIGDRIEVLRDDGLPVRVIFDKVPENLRARPTLSVTSRATRGGTPAGDAELSDPGARLEGRLCHPVRRGGRADRRPGLGHADQHHRHDLRQRRHPAGRRRGRAAAPAVDYGRGYPPPPPPPPAFARPGPKPPDASGSATSISIRCPSGPRSPTSRPSRSASSTSAARRRSAPTSSATAGSARRPAASANTRAAILERRASGGLGDALPAGTVRVYQRDARGNAQFVGESAIGHTPMGSELGLITGEAFDVKVQPVVEKRERRQRQPRWRTTMRYTLTNASPRPSPSTWSRPGLWGDTRIVDESHEERAPLGRRGAVARRRSRPTARPTVTATFDTRF